MHEENSELQLNNNTLGANISSAESLLMVKSRFISLEQAAYCLGWKNILNPRSESKSIIYNAMGPDVTTVLLTTNATDVYGIDPRPPKLTDTQFFLDNWTLVDTNAYSLPPSHTYFQEKDSYRGKVPPSAEDIDRALKAMLVRRKTRGYWDVGEMFDWSIERCFVIELKKLDVDPASVRLNNVGGRLQVEFLWSYPGEKPKPRKIHFVANFTYDILEDPSSVGLHSVDGFYEKSMDAERGINPGNNDLQGIGALIRPGGFVLIGSCQGTDEEKRLVHESNMRALGAKFSPISIGAEYSNLIVNSEFGRNSRKYGWELEGAVKTK